MIDKNKDTELQNNASNTHFRENLASHDASQDLVLLRNMCEKSSL